VRLGDPEGLRIGFLHTSAVHTANRLVAEIDPELGTVVVVDESLLDDARRNGPAHAGVAAGITRALEQLESAGAATIVCTCSTIGGEAERLAEQISVTVARVDRAMAEAAIRIGSRIAVVAALESTLAPTTDLIQGVPVQISTVLCEGAWAKFESGDRDGYLRSVAATCESLDGSCDVIVLAQASMAGSADFVERSTPILSSPSLAREHFTHGPLGSNRWGENAFLLPRSGSTATTAGSRSWRGYSAMLVSR